MHFTVTKGRLFFKTDYSVGILCGHELENEIKSPPGNRSLYFEGSVKCCHRMVTRNNDCFQNSYNIAVQTTQSSAICGTSPWKTLLLSTEVI